METDPQAHDIDLSKISEEEVMQLEFDDEDDADSFYNAVARSMGFGIRKEEIYMSKNGTLISREWKCSAAGFRSKKYMNSEVKIYEQRQNTRFGCQARFRIKLDSVSNKYRASKFSNDHNHPMLSLPCIHFLRSHRNITAGDCDLANGMYKSGLPTSRIYTYMSTQVGGFENVGFTYKDLSNRLTKERHNEIVEGDAEGAIGYMAAMKEVDSMFYYRYDKDEENRLTRIFWADGTCISDYSTFGDVLIFDATYRRNVYNMPFVILVGVNNHNRTVLFGCAMMADETLESYVWLLDCFLHAMNGKHPISVVTDGDKAMRGAIRRIFTGSKHRLCSWHLQRNAQTNIKHNGFCSRFTYCMQLKTIVEFEAAWNQLLVDYNLVGNKWCEDMYEIRDLWAESYMVGTFFAGVRTTTRSEGINSFFKGFLRTKMRLFEVVRGYNSGQAKLRENSLRLQAIDESGKPVLTTGLRSIERHASELYTRTMFIEFRKQIEEMHKLWDSSPLDSGAYREYYVSAYGDESSKWTVRYYSSVSDLKCDCNMFESLGLPCAHMVHVMKVENMKEIPASCILPRWTKKDTCAIAKVHDKNEAQPIKFGALTSACARLSYYASHLTDGYVKARDVVSSLTRELELLYMKEIGNVVGCGGKSYGKRIAHDVLDPAVVRGKGRPKNVRKGLFPKQRKCSNCKGTGHNKKGCSLKATEDDQTFETTQVGMQTGDTNNRYQTNLEAQPSSSTQYYNMHENSSNNYPNQPFANYGYSSGGQPNQSFATYGYSDIGQSSYVSLLQNFEVGSTQYVSETSNEIESDSDDSLEE